MIKIQYRDDGGAFVLRGDLPSWWRSTNRLYWHIHSCFWGTCKAVVDDFGNLVRVQ